MTTTSSSITDELEMLERVLLRLATTEESALGNVLDKLLPRLLSMLTPSSSSGGGGGLSTKTTSSSASSSPPLDDRIKNKIIEIVSHINRRIRDRPSIPIPFRSLLGLCTASSPSSSIPPSPPSTPSPLALSFILMYLKMGFPRLSPSDIDELMPSWLCLSSYPEGAVRNTILQFILAKGIQYVHVPPLIDERNKKFHSWLQLPNDIDTITQACIDTLLYLRLLAQKGITGYQSSVAPSASSTTTVVSPSSPTNAGSISTTSPNPNPTLVIPPGMSLRSMARVVGVDQITINAIHTAANAIPSDEFLARKRAILRFASSGLFPDSRILQIALAGLSDTHTDIIGISEDLLRRVNNVDVEDPWVIQILFQFLLGQGTVPQLASPSINIEQNIDLRFPAALPVRLRVLTLCTRSRRAATSFPMTLKVIFESWFGNGVNLKLQQNGVRFAHMAFQLTPPNVLLPFAPVFLQGLLKLLNQATTTANSTDNQEIDNNNNNTMDTTDLSTSNSAGSGLQSVLGNRETNEKIRLRELVYSAIGALAIRVPSIFTPSLLVPKLLFARLPLEDSSVRLSIAEALSALGTVYSFRRSISSTALGIHHPPASTTVLEELHSLLREYVYHPETRVRLTVIDWCIRVFPFSDVRARYTCACLVGDARVEVREAARSGLRPFIRKSSAARANAFRGADGDLDRGELSGIARRSDPTKAPNNEITDTSSKDTTTNGSSMAVTGTGTVDDTVPNPEEDIDIEDEIDIVADNSTFVRLASIYPAFASLIRYITSLEEDEDQRVRSTQYTFDPQSMEGENSNGTVSSSSVSSSTEVLYVDNHDTSQIPLGKKIRSLSALSLSVLLEFCNTCLDASAAVSNKTASEYIQLLDSGNEISLLHAYRTVIEYAFSLEPAIPEASKAHETAAACLQLLLAAAPYRLSAIYAGRIGWVLRWLKDSNPSIRRSMAYIIGTTAEALPLDDDDKNKVYTQGPSLIDKRTGTNPSNGSDTLTTTLSSASSSSVPHHLSVAYLVTHLLKPAESTDVRLMDIKHGSLISLGYILGKGIPRLRTREQQQQQQQSGSSSLALLRLVFDAKMISKATEIIIRQLPSRYTIIREASTAALTTLARYAPLPFPMGDITPIVASVQALKRGEYELLSTLSRPEGLTDDYTNSTTVPTGTLTRASVILQLFRIANGLEQQVKSRRKDMDIYEQSTSGEVGSSSEGSLATESAAVCLGAIISGELRTGAALSAFLQYLSSTGMTTPTTASSTNTNENMTIDEDEDLYGDGSVSKKAKGEPTSTAASVPTTIAIPPIAQAAIEVLTTLSINKYEQIQFTIGSALVEVITGKASVLANQKALGTSSTVLLDKSSPITGMMPVSLGENYNNQDNSFVLSTVSSIEQNTRNYIANYLLDYIITTPLQSIKAVERTAAAIWLLSIVHAYYGSKSSTTSAHQVLVPRLAILQTAFMRLLSEKSQFTQEAAAKGLALVYEASDETIRRKLVTNLLDSLNTGKNTSINALPSTSRDISNLSSVSGTGTTLSSQSGDESSSSSSSTSSATPASTVSAGPASLALSAAGEASYRELCAMANEVGQPDLIYRFLALASHHALWHTRGGAGFGLEALLRGKARTEIAPYLKGLIPKLYRYQYDPSPRIRESMARLWAVLVRDPRKTVTEYIHPIVSELVRASESSNWREREAACAGLIDIIGGRTYEEIGTHLENLWRSVLRAIDDIKDSVRETAMDTLKSLGKLSLRLCNPLLSPKKDAQQSVSILLPFLLRDGVTSAVKDAQTQCIKYLVEVSKVAGILLRPHIPEIVHTMLISMSSFEDEGLSYLQVHADGQSGLYGQNLSGEKLESMRIHATRTGPFGEVLDRCISQIREMNTYELLGETPPEHVVEGPALQYLNKGKESKEIPNAMETDEEIKTETNAFDSGTIKTNGSEGILSLLIDKLRTLIRSGVGLPTRGATVRFLISLVDATGEAIKIFTTPLLKTLENTFEDSSATLRKEFVTVAAHIARYTPPVSYRRLLNRFNDLARSNDSALRTTAGYGYLSLLKYSGDKYQDYINILLPITFLCSLDTDPTTKEVWSEVYEVLTTSGSLGGGEGSVRLYINEIINKINEALESSAWAIRQQGGNAILRLLTILHPRSKQLSNESLTVRTVNDTVPNLILPEADFITVPPPVIMGTSEGTNDAGNNALSLFYTQHVRYIQPDTLPEMIPHTYTLLPRLCTAIPGRIWEGKEILVQALGTLICSTPSVFRLSTPNDTDNTIVRSLGNSILSFEPLVNYSATGIMSTLPSVSSSSNTNLINEGIPLEPIIRLLGQQCVRGIMQGSSTGSTSTTTVTDSVLQYSMVALRSFVRIGYTFPSLPLYSFTLSIILPLFRRYTIPYAKELDTFLECFTSRMDKSTIPSVTGTTMLVTATASSATTSDEEENTVMAENNDKVNDGYRKATDESDQSSSHTLTTSSGTISSIVNTVPSSSSSTAGTINSTNPPVASSRSNKMMGGKFNESKEGEARTAAKEKEETEAEFVALLCAALVTGYPSFPVPLSSPCASVIKNVLHNTKDDETYLRPYVSSELPLSSLSFYTTSFTIETQERLFLPIIQTLFGIYHILGTNILYPRITILRTVALLFVKSYPTVIGKHYAYLTGEITKLLTTEEKYTLVRTAVFHILSAWSQHGIVFRSSVFPVSSSSSSTSTTSIPIIRSLVSLTQNQLTNVHNDPRIEEAARKSLTYLQQWLKTETNP